MSQPDFHSNALQFASLHLKDWNLVTKQNSTITFLTGNSNKVFHLSTTLPIIPKDLIYRVFGPNEITEKSRERQIFSQLSHHHFGPKNLGSSDTERLEEYFEGFLPTPNKLFYDKEILTKICKKLRKLHYLDMSKAIGGEGIITDLNINKWTNLILNKKDLFEAAGEWENVQKVVANKIAQGFNDVIPRESEVVYCHLDPSPLNFLYNAQDNKVKFVDFEFSGYSYRSLDFGLMLSEVQMDYLFDSPPYFKACEELAPSDLAIKDFVIAYGEGKEMWVEIKRSLIAADYIWSIWGLACYNGPTVGYNHLEFGLMRFRKFFKALKQYEVNGKIEYLKAIADELF